MDYISYETEYGTASYKKEEDKKEIEIRFLFPLLTNQNFDASKIQYDKMMPRDFTRDKGKDVVVEEWYCYPQGSGLIFKIPIV